MLFKNFTLKSTFFCLFIFLASNCADSSKSIPSTTVPETKAAVVQVTPAPFLGQMAKVQGENQAIKITDNLKSSIEQQELPKIWLEFDRENGEILRTELDNKFTENLYSAGQALFRYQYVIDLMRNKFVVTVTL